MTLPTSVIADCVTGYAARFHAAVGARHHVASPLGAWLLLALAAPASTGPDRQALAEILGCEVDTAAQAAAALLAAPHPIVASAAAVWTARNFDGTADFQRWLTGLPGAVTTGDLPAPADLDRWARDHTFGLIPRFPVDTARAYLVLASALATMVSWRIPFRLGAAEMLGGGSPWARTLSRVLLAPRGHDQFITTTPTAGDVIVHMAQATRGLVVVSLAALPDAPASRVLALAHDLGRKLATGAPIERRDLATLPLGQGPLWAIREVMADADSYMAVVPAWSASSQHDLTDPMLGFAVAKNSLVPGPDPWDARQAVMAQYTRTGFKAAAVTAQAVTLGMRIRRWHRLAELRFGHPYAVVAFTTDHGLWNGLPVFSAWVAEPEDAAGNEDDSSTASERARPV